MCMNYRNGLHGNWWIHYEVYILFQKQKILKKLYFIFIMTLVSTKECMAYFDNFKVNVKKFRWILERIFLHLQRNTGGVCQIYPNLSGAVAFQCSKEEVKSRHRAWWRDLHNERVTQGAEQDKLPRVEPYPLQKEPYRQAELCRPTEAAFLHPNRVFQGQDRHLDFQHLEGICCSRGKVVFIQDVHTLTFTHISSV